MTILFIITKKFNEEERLPTIPGEANKELKDFLGRCFTADEKTRWSAVQLADHGFLKPKDSSSDSQAKVIQGQCSTNAWWKWELSVFRLLEMGVVCH